jgi:hypothetical protein
MNARTMRIALWAAIAAITLSGAARSDEPVTLERHGNAIEVLVGGKPFTTYYFGPESPKPYLHPLRSAQGTIVTRGWPMVKNISGESHDHPHHRAMFFAHGDINGIDFWGEQRESQRAQTAHGKFYSSENLPKGRTAFHQLLEMETGTAWGAVSADFDLVGPNGKAIGSEVQSYLFRGDDSTRTIDCEFTLRADRDVSLHLGDTKEGTFAIRLVKALEEPTGQMLNSNGGVGERAIWGQRADWVDYSGNVAGEELGVAIFDNPANFRHPTPWHARGYGLFAVNPFGLHDFLNKPLSQVNGGHTIWPGQSLRLRYRVYIHHGTAAEAKVAKAYEQYAHSTPWNGPVPPERRP